jgi:integrase
MPCISFKPHQVQAVYDNFTGPHAAIMRLVFLTGCWTGLRISDVLGLTYEHFCNNGHWMDTIVVNEKKNKKVREIPLGNEFKLTIRDYITERLFTEFHTIDEPVFTTKSGRPITYDPSLRAIKNAARAAGLPMVPRSIGTHCMRKTFAAMLLEDLIKAGLPIAEIFQILCDTLNQGDVRVTMKYVGWDKEKAREYTLKHTNKKLVNL